jgi:predicted signal transduction protein with EAL and GGDEF domain
MKLLSILLRDHSKSAGQFVSEYSRSARYQVLYVKSDEDYSQIGSGIGVGHARHYPDSAEAGIVAANDAMYLAKRSGKGTVRLAGPKSH